MEMAKIVYGDDDRYSDGLNAVRGILWSLVIELSVACLVGIGIILWVCLK